MLSRVLACASRACLRARGACTALPRMLIARVLTYACMLACACVRLRACVLARLRIACARRLHCTSSHAHRARACVRMHVMCTCVRAPALHLCASRRHVHVGFFWQMTTSNHQRQRLGCRLLSRARTARDRRPCSLRATTAAAAGIHNDDGLLLLLRQMVLLLLPSSSLRSAELPCAPEASPNEATLSLSLYSLFA